MIIRKIKWQYNNRKKNQNDRMTVNKKQFSCVNCHNKQIKSIIIKYNNSTWGNIKCCECHEMTEWINGKNSFISNLKFQTSKFKIQSFLFFFL